MERLTYWCDNGHGDGKWFVAIDAEGGEDYGPHVDRLAAYEETGLEPEDFKQTFSEDTILKLAGQALGITPDRLRELAQTDKGEQSLFDPRRCRGRTFRKKVVYAKQKRKWTV